MKFFKINNLAQFIHRAKFTNHLSLVFRLMQCNLRYNARRHLTQMGVFALFCALLGLVSFFNTQRFSQMTAQLMEVMLKTPSAQVDTYVKAFQEKDTQNAPWGEDEQQTQLNKMIELAKNWFFHIKPVMVFEDPMHPWPIGTREAILKAHYLVSKHPFLTTQTLDLKELDSQAVVGWKQDSALPGGGTWVIRHNMSLDKYQALSAAVVGISDGPRKAWYWRQIHQTPNHPYVTGFYQHMLGNPDEFQPPNFNDIGLVFIGSMLILLFEVFMMDFGVKWDKRRQEGELRVFLQYPTPMWVAYLSEIGLNTLRFFLMAFIITCVVSFSSGEYRVGVGLALGLGLGLMASMVLMGGSLLLLSIALFCYLAWVRRILMGLVLFSALGLFASYFAGMQKVLQKTGIIGASHTFSYLTFTNLLWKHGWSILFGEVVVIGFLCWVIDLVIRRKRYALY